MSPGDTHEAKSRFTTPNSREIFFSDSKSVCNLKFSRRARLERPDAKDVVNTSAMHTGEIEIKIGDAWRERKHAVSIFWKTTDLSAFNVKRVLASGGKDRFYNNDRPEGCGFLQRPTKPWGIALLDTSPSSKSKST